MTDLEEELEPLADLEPVTHLEKDLEPLAELEEEVGSGGSLSLLFTFKKELEQLKGLSAPQPCRA